MPLVLAGDIGGTKTILRLVDWPSSGDGGAAAPLDEETYPSQDFPDLVPLVRQFLSRSDRESPIEKACFGIAGPVVDNSSELTNLSWSLDGDRLSRELGIGRVELINDFAAIGYGVRELPPEHLLTLQEAPADPARPLAVIGAGTGLGEAFSIPDPDGSYRVFGSEGGHADFAPRSAVEYQLLSYLLDRHGIERVSVERVVSGRGIASIYEFFLCRDPDSGSAEMAEVYSTWREEAGKPEKTLDLSERIATFAQERADSLCERTMKLFIDAYGAEAGNLALKLLPYGGLYIAGGVAARNATLIKEGGFLSAFLAKGRMSSLLRRIPVYLVLDRKVGLLGAASRARRA